MRLWGALCLGITLIVLQNSNEHGQVSLEKAFLSVNTASRPRRIPHPLAIVVSKYPALSIVSGVEPASDWCDFCGHHLRCLVFSRFVLSGFHAQALSPPPSHPPHPYDCLQDFRNSVLSACPDNREIITFTKKRGLLGKVQGIFWVRVAWGPRL